MSHWPLALGPRRNLKFLDKFPAGGRLACLAGFSGRNSHLLGGLEGFGIVRLFVASDSLIAYHLRCE